MRALVIFLSLAAVACSGNKEKDKAPVLQPDKVETNTNVCPAINPAIYQEFTKDGKPGNVIKFLKVTKLDNGNFVIQLDKDKEGLEVNGKVKASPEGNANAGCVLEDGVKVIKYSIGGKNVNNGTIAANDDGSLTLKNTDKQGRATSYRLQKVGDVEAPKTPGTAPETPKAPAQECKNFAGKYVLQGEGTAVKTVTFAQVENFQSIVMKSADGKTKNYSTKPVDDEEGEGQTAFCADKTYINVIMNAKKDDGSTETLYWAFTIPVGSADTVILTITNEDGKPVNNENGQPFGPFTYKKAN